MIFCALLYDYVLDKCVCASAWAMALAVVPHRDKSDCHEFPPALEKKSNILNVNKLCSYTAVEKLNFQQRPRALQVCNSRSNNMIYSFSQYCSLFNF